MQRVIHNKSLNWKRYSLNMLSKRVNAWISYAILKKRTNCVHFRRFLSGKFVERLKERGLIASSFPDQNHLNFKLSQPQTFYAGFDPTSDSLHVGNLLVLMNLLHCIREGHRVICVIGESSARIGDPSDKVCERERIDRHILLDNAAGISSDINKVFANHYKYFWKNTDRAKDTIQDPIVISNENWYKTKNLIDFLADIGKHISVGQLLSRNFVKMRLNNTKISLSEFFYQAIQAYDWYYLYHKYGCRFQIGGSDQMGNIKTGYDLIQLLKTNKDEIPCFGLLIPLLTEDTGGKISKSSNKSIWLSREKMSAFSFYQHFVNLPDIKLETYLKLFTFYTLQEIESILNKHLKAPEKRHAQKKLAESVTLLVHGEDGLKSAIEATKALFENDIKAFAHLDERTLCEVFGSDTMTTMFLEPEETTIVDVVVKASKCREIDAVKMVEEGGVRINDKKISSASHVINDENILDNNTSLMKIGKRRYYVIKWA